MPSLRQSVCMFFPLFVMGCIDPTPYIYNTSPFSQKTQAEGNAHCSQLYANVQFSHLQGKMPILPGAIPTRKMLTIGTIPNDEEIAALQTLESAIRNCRTMRAAAGIPTSATEDILAARLSKLRYGLYKGEIPYAVYNHGVALATRDVNTFMMAGEKAAQEGKVYGRQRQRESQIMAEISAYRRDLSNFNNSIPSGTWICKGPSCY